MLKRRRLTISSCHTGCTSQILSNATLLVTDRSRDKESDFVILAVKSSWRIKSKSKVSNVMTEQFCFLIVNKTHVGTQNGSRRLDKCVAINDGTRKKVLTP